MRPSGVRPDRGRCRLERFRARLTAGSTPSTRIGDAERADAQRALQDHLNPGRSPTWNVGTDCCSDIAFAFDASRLSIDDGHAVVNGPLGFETCLHSATYTNSAIDRGSLRPGQVICVRTNGHRLAVVTIVSASEQAVEFGATVWDPPVPS